MLLKSFQIAEFILKSDDSRMISKCLIYLSKRCTILSFLSSIVESGILEFVLYIAKESSDEVVIVAALSCIASIYDLEDKDAINYLIKIGIVDTLKRTLAIDSTDIQYFSTAILDRTLMCDETFIREILSTDLINIIWNAANEGKFESKKTTIKFICNLINCAPKDDLQPIVDNSIQEIVSFLEAGDDESIRFTLNALRRILILFEDSKKKMLDCDIMDVLSELSESRNNNISNTALAFISELE
jgi:hypothetical protein